ncbi:UbiA prenyltransferase family-domain containing protein [Nitzschia inconspicua]|uniref:UbiA prenyltransferase family-domain containing protein n=1 Tax=Nitzschia inconspicua TaxID=303405 RepID=A0A9K3L1S2_9STRA|nr:UbiA prenyltransferase family-domain containing protein [Nitzschia inconspicua]
MPPPSDKTKRPPSWKVWFIAARPHTLTASVAPNIVSYSACLALLFENSDNISLPFLDVAHLRNLTFQWTAFCMLMQLGTNLHNDYADFVKGADTDKRVGQPRATQQGWLTPAQTSNAAGSVLLMGLGLGFSFLYQIWKTNRSMIEEGAAMPHLAIMAFIVLSSIFNAFAYTGGPWPLGYLGLGNFSIGYIGLGDLFVFLYFGLVATLTLPYLYLTTTTTSSSGNLQDTLKKFLPYAIQVAALATNIIVVNNLRDRHTDVLADKRTLAVRLGAAFCRREYLVNLIITYGIQLWMTVSPVRRTQSSSYYEAAVQLLPLLTVPLAMKEWKAICTKEGSALNAHVGGAAKVQFFFCILLAVSFRISS